MKQSIRNFEDGRVMSTWTPRPPFCAVGRGAIERFPGLDRQAIGAIQVAGLNKPFLQVFGA